MQVGFDQIDDELNTLALRHGMIPSADDDLNDDLASRTTSKRWKHKLEHRHAASEFTPLLPDNASPSLQLFYRFARAVCRVGRIPRKELFETWTMALFVHQAFPDAQRIADLASGQGLLAWALLALADQQQQQCCKNGEEATTTPMLSVVCIDRQRPKAVDLMRSAMLEEWPHFENSWDFVQGQVESVMADSSTLIVGIHACSTLSDTILEIAIQGCAPLALVPCCHSKKCLKGQLPHQYARAKTNTVGLEELPVGLMQLADFIDGMRKQKLEDAGYHVQEALIPKVFTPKNRILLARPTTNSMVNPTMMTNEFVTRYLDVAIPVADNATARETIRQNCTYD